MPIRSIGNSPIRNVSSRSPLEADLKTAAQLKTALNEAPFLARSCPAPKLNARDQWHAPNGNQLIPVMLHRGFRQSNGFEDGQGDHPTPPIWQSTVAFVDPKTNQYYKGEFTATESGLRRYFEGPVDLPAGVQFKGKRFTSQEMESLTKAANERPKADRRTMLMTLETYEYQISWDGKRPAAVRERVRNLKIDMLASDPYQPDPNGYVTHGLALANDPNKVVFERIRGGRKEYSQPIDLRFGCLQPEP